MVLYQSGKIVGGGVKVNYEENTSNKESDTIFMERSNHDMENDTPIEVDEIPTQLIID